MFWPAVGLLVAVLGLVAFVAARLASQHSFNLGLAALRVHRFEIADRHFIAAAKFNRRGGEVALMRSRVAWVKGDPDASQQRLQAAAKGGLEPERIEQERLLIQIRAGSAAAMRWRLPTMLRRTSVEDGPAILEAFTAGFLAQRDIQQAAEVLAIWEQADPDDPRIHHWRGVLNRAIGKAADAIEHFKSALRLAPEMASARLALADSLKSDLFFPEALPHYQEIIRAQPEIPGAAVGLAICQLKTNRADEGVRGLNAFITAHPEHVQARMALAEYYQDRGEPHQVVATLQPLVDAETIDISLNYLLATAFARLSEPSQADAYFDSFQRMNRQLGMTRMLKKQYEMEPSGELARKIAAALMQCKWQDAGVWIMLALSSEPRDAELHLMMAEYLKRSGR